MKKTVYDITPIGKPRMTQRDKWKHRDIVQRYFAFKDIVRLYRVAVNNAGCKITFILPFPKTWSKKKCKAMEGKPHQSKPDIDNLLKALLDTALLKGDDKEVWNISITKIWGSKGKIIIEK